MRGAGSPGVPRRPARPSLCSLSPPGPTEHGEGGHAVGDAHRGLRRVVPDPAHADHHLRLRVEVTAGGSPGGVTWGSPGGVTTGGSPGGVDGVTAVALLVLPSGRWHPLQVGVERCGLSPGRMTALRAGAVPRKGWLGLPYPFSHRGGRGLGAQSRPSLSPSQLGPSITSVITPSPPDCSPLDAGGQRGGAGAAQSAGPSCSCPAKCPQASHRGSLLPPTL